MWLCRFYVTLHIGDYCRTENRPLCFALCYCRTENRPLCYCPLCYLCYSDKSFYESSGGGVTLSGGECLSQADFCSELLQRLKAEGINTALDMPNTLPDILPEKLQLEKAEALFECFG